jgi:hypothetical protein
MPPVSPTRNTLAVWQHTYDASVPAGDQSRNTFTTWFKSAHASWDLTGETPLPFIDLRYFGRVFGIVDQQLPAAGVHVLATDDMTGPLPVTGPHVVVLCLNDEFARTPRYAFDVGLVVKPYGVRRRPYLARPAPLVAAQEVAVQLRRLAYLSRAAVGTVVHRHRPCVVDVPLGVRALYHRDFVPFAERRYDVMFAGSLVNEPGEEARKIPTQKVRSRRAFLDQLARTQQAMPDVAFSVRTVPSHWTAMQSVGAYLDELMQSRIVLCPRGSSLETYRFFEALRFGCVPVYEALPRRSYYRGSPAVQCADWSKLPDALRQLCADPVALRERHEAALRWYEGHVAPAAVAATITAAISPTLVSAVHQ